MKSKIKAFLHDDNGATAIEYGLIAALIAVEIIGSSRLLGSQISATFNKVSAAIKNG